MSDSDGHKYDETFEKKRPSVITFDRGPLNTLRLEKKDQM